MLDHSQVLDIMKKLLIQVLLWQYAFISLWQIASCGIAGLWARRRFSFIRTHPGASSTVVPLMFPPAAKSTPLAPPPPPPPPAFAVLGLFNFSCVGGCVTVSQCGFK